MIQREFKVSIDCNVHKDGELIFDCLEDAEKEFIDKCASIVAKTTGFDVDHIRNCEKFKKWKQMLRTCLIYLETEEV